MTQAKILKIRPYARLLTMLGEQLIKNERIALIELIKNSYDADADWVKVTFQGFGSNYEIDLDSKIIIEDNGHGMSQELIEKHWLNPATPKKKQQKNIRRTTDKGRIIQGEKGIGRFAILKLGRCIEIISKTEKDNEEHRISYDFSRYDDEFLTEDKNEKDLYIDDLKVTLINRKPERILPSELSFGTRKKKRSNHGTIIEISNLKGGWNERNIRFVHRDLTKLQSIFSKKKHAGFEVIIYRDDMHQKFQEDYLEKLDILLNERSVIKIENGYFDSEKMEYRFNVNETEKTISILDPAITGLKVFKDRFGNAGSELDHRAIECGGFEFGFYVFDFSRQVPAKYQLDREDKSIIREHRIYLYRDNIRVYPYGEPDDDWLRIDAYRGTIGAGHFFSNDQVVGFVNISQKSNPKLRDKTNREGLIDDGNATEDFIVLLQTFLSYIRHGDYARYRIDIEKKKEQDIITSGQVQKGFDELKSAAEGNKEVLTLLTKTEKKYNSEKQYLTRRAEITDELAGVGLSVEMASHDIMGIMGKVLINLDGIIRDLMSKDEIYKEELLKDLQSIRGGMGFIENQLKDIQLLFKSSKQRRKSIRIQDIISKVNRIYRRLLNKEAIELTINTLGSPLIAKTTDAVLLQLLLNLFDNSIYWLQQTSKQDKKIEVLLDGDNGKMLFSDNGPGINEDDAPYIFEAFYSGKGDEGRGLGLYIAKQLLERNEYSIDLAEIKSEKLLSGANFVINFIAEDTK